MINEHSNDTAAAEFLENSQPNDWSLSPLPLGKMWLDLLKFYAFRFSHSETAVCVRTVDKVTRASKNWGNRRLAVEDPFHPTVNMASPLGVTIPPPIKCRGYAASNNRIAL